MKALKTILGFLTFVVIAIVMAQIAEAETDIGLAMAIAVYTKVCEKNVSGNARVFIASAALVTSVTVTAGEITAITATTAFKESQADIDSIIRTEVAAGRRSNISYTHRVEMKFAKPDKALNVFRDSLTDASPCGMCAIVQDGNGACWLVGFNEADTTNRGLYVVQDDTNSGALPTDEDGNVVTIALETLSGYVDIPFNATLTATIIGDTAVFIDYV